MIIERHLWKRVAFASLIIGMLLAIFMPALQGSANPGDFDLNSIIFRLCSFTPLNFFAFGLLALLFRFAKTLFRCVFTRRTLPRCMRALMALIIVAGVLYIEENWRGQRIWTNYKHQLEAKGEKLEFDNFVPQPVPDDQNFALTPVVASSYCRFLDRDGHLISPQNTNVANRLTMNMYRTDIPITTNLRLGNWQNNWLTDLIAWQAYYRTMFVANNMMSEPPPIPGTHMSEHFDTNVYRNVVVVLGTNEFSINKEPKSPATDVLFALSKYDPTLEELRHASRLPFARFPLNYTINNPSQIVAPHLAAMKSCALVLRLRATAELANGHAAKALADVRLILYLASSIRHEPIQEAFQFQIAMVNLAIQPVWEGLARRQWSADQMAALERDLAGIDTVADYGFAMRAARASNLKSIEYLRTERMANSITDWNNNTMLIPTLIYRLLPDGWFYLNYWVTARVFEASLPTAAEVEQRILSPAISDRFARAENLERGWHHIPPNFWLAFVPPLPREAMNSARVQAGVDMARVACALEGYRLAHDEYPQMLDALAPQFIETIPHDIINGQPLHFHRTTDGKFLLYSVGWNGKDDGGRPEDPKQFPLRKSDGDWVWPYPHN